MEPSANRPRKITNASAVTSHSIHEAPFCQGSTNTYATGTTPNQPDHDGLSAPVGSLNLFIRRLVCRSALLFARDSCHLEGATSGFGLTVRRSRCWQTLFTNAAFSRDKAPSAATADT